MKTADLKIQPVILSGGSGTRLWPLSRKEHPKQYLPLISDSTMLQETMLRLNGLDDLLDPIVVCNANHRFLVAEQCRQIDIEKATILLEPIGKNTAPAIAAAAFRSLDQMDDAILLILSADHFIQDIDAFHKAINIAKNQAQNNQLVTFGVVPTDVNTGYGYIKTSESDIDDVCKVENFVEKPDQETAKSYINQGSYLWNSGMFLFKASVLIDELTAYSPSVVAPISDAISNAEEDMSFIYLDKRAFELSPSDSIDYALMERSDKVMVVPLDAGWSDIGSWSALYDIGRKDDDGNVIYGDVLTKDAVNTYISADHHMVAAIGVDNLIIVDTPNAMLVSTRDRAQEVKYIVEQLQQNNREEQSHHRKVYRPWGWYDLIETGEHFQVKRLHVKPGAKLSVQMHHQRAEHWVVVNGVATVVNGDERLTLRKGDSTYIPVGVIHALENMADDPLEVIEVQSGTYLGEDDIVRFEDIYGRVKT